MQALFINLRLSNTSNTAFRLITIAAGGHRGLFVRTPNEPAAVLRPAAAAGWRLLRLGHYSHFLAEFTHRSIQSMAANNLESNPAYF